MIFFIKRPPPATPTTAARIIPVSYTHLDVYKRQDPDAPKKEEARIGMNPVEGEGFVMKSADDTAEEPVEAIKEVVCEEE